jgi:hypothetical protein
LYDSDSKAGKEDKEKSGRKPRHRHAAKSSIARRKEQFLWNLAFRDCLHLKAKFVFTFKTRFLFNGRKR